MDKHKEAIQARMQRERDQRIQGIQDAARSVFIAEGYTKAIMDKIALKSGITKPTIYQYFKRLLSRISSPQPFKVMNWPLKHFS
jgi:hypothetical protein